MENPEDIVDEVPKPDPLLTPEAASPGVDAPDAAPAEESPAVEDAAAEAVPVEPTPRLYQLRAPGIRPRFVARPRRPAVLRRDCPPDLRHPPEDKRNRTRLR